MYFPIGWPKVLNLPELKDSPRIKQVKCNRDRILLAIITTDTISIWFCKPCVPIVIYRRTEDSIQKLGTNEFVEWKPDSSMLVISTTEGHLLLYQLNVITNQKGLYIQTDSPHANLRRDSAELFIKEIIPPLTLTLAEEVHVWDGKITCMVCITLHEMMVATSAGHILRYKWDGTQNRDYNLDLRRIPFCINQQVSKAVPIVEENTYIIAMEYSPLVGGFAIVFNDGRAAFLTATSLRFDPNQTQGIWAQGIENAVSTSVNHKYRLITFGRSNSECVVYYVDPLTGGLATSHNCALSGKDYPGCPGAVHLVAWSPDGCALAVAWERGGIALWSTFGALLMCSLGWDYGLHVDLERRNPLHVACMEWGTEGYQLWMIRTTSKQNLDNSKDSNLNPSNSDDLVKNLVQMDFVKSALTINPCMGHQSHLYLQGEDRLYINSADTLVKKNTDRTSKDDTMFTETISSAGNTLSEGRQWLVLPVPSTYTATNWPIRYSAIDCTLSNIAIAGRTGLVHYAVATRRWKLFGNESQEKDFIVCGGLLWWRDYACAGAFSVPDNQDELRFYPRDSKLDNKYAKIVKLNAAILLMNNLQDELVTFGADGQVTIWNMKQYDSIGNVELTKLQLIDISALCVHPACIVSLTLTSLKTETAGRKPHGDGGESLVLNVSGRLLMVQREINRDRASSGGSGLMPTVLASCVENVWVPSRRRADKVHLTEALWLFCGAHGMRVWLPLYPRDGDKSHTFMSKRIMLPFHLRIYPLAILFEDAIILGAENDTVLYTTDTTSPFSLPFSVLQRTSQVYLHQILRQLIRRNLGYHAWEIARSCTALPYFPHSLELLLHEVLEEEATSKEPIPDAQLPSVIEFIQEFSVYLQTVVQCARKTEIALWPYLFSAAGKPKDLFQECMAKRQLDTAASYLIILQNLEASSISRQYATLLLDTALDQSKWELAKELVRFLRAIDPNDVESPRSSIILPHKLTLSQPAAATPPVSPNDVADIGLILGNVQQRVRSYSTTVMPNNKTSGGGGSGSCKDAVGGVSGGGVVGMNSVAESPGGVITRRKKSMPATGAAGAASGNTAAGVQRNEMSDANNMSTPNNPTTSTTSATAEEFFIDVILQRHARRLLTSHRLTDLGYFAANLDFHLVAWLGKERDRAARVDDFVTALKRLHDEFDWPYPTATILDGPSQSLPESPNSSLDQKMKSLQLEIEQGNVGLPKRDSSQVGDSGYMSFPGIPCGTGLITSHNNTMDTVSQIGDTETESQPYTPSAMRHLQTTVIPSQYPFPEIGNSKPTSPLAYVSVDNSFTYDFSNKVHASSTTSHLASSNNHTNIHGGLLPHFNLTETHINANSMMQHQPGGDDGMSIVSSAWAEERGDFLSGGGTDSSWEMPSTQILEQLSNTGGKGSQRSEVQLRYLLQIFMEAGCLEWSILIAVLLRDALAIVRTVNAAKSFDQSIESVSRLKQGLQILHYWTHTECLGYRTFMLAVQNQISVLSTIQSTKIHHQQIVDHQKAISSTLSKLTPNSATPNIPIASTASIHNSSAQVATSEHIQRVRKVSGMYGGGGDTSSQSGGKVSLGGSVTSAQREQLMKEVNANGGIVDREEIEEEKDSLIPESTGCAIM